MGHAMLGFLKYLCDALGHASRVSFHENVMITTFTTVIPPTCPQSRDCDSAASD
jgi:hypothetical protein